MKKDYILCEDCKKKVYYDIEKGITTPWCNSCKRSRFRKPVLKIKLTPKEYKLLWKWIVRAEWKGKYDFLFGYYTKKHELRVIRW